MKQHKALILVPCCKKKTVVPSTEVVSALPGLPVLREKLLEAIKITPVLKEKEENRKGILDPEAAISRAIDLYCGRFYNQAEDLLRALAGGQVTNVNVLIVSAFYGLVLPHEGIKEYELLMSDTLSSGMKIYRYWQDCGLWEILQDYIKRNKISHVWSLLPNSRPKFPYQHVFKQFWGKAGDYGVSCFHVRVPGARTSTGYQRARWLGEVMSSDPGLLVNPEKMPSEWSNTPGYRFEYISC